MRYLIVLAALPLCAQTWTPATKLGIASSKASLAMNPVGQGIAVFSYAPNGGTGTLYYSNLLAGQTWPAAIPMAGSNVYDANSPQVALDASGAALATFDAYQIDSYNNAYATVWGYSSGSNWSGFGVLGSPITRLPALLRFYGTSPTYINNAVVLIPSSCGLVSEVDSSYARFEATITTDCLSAYDFALNAAGYGVVGYKTTAGAVNAAERFGGASDGVWTAPTPLAAANSLTSQVAVANAPTNEAIVVYTVGKKGTATVQVWQASLTGSGSWLPPVKLSSTACSVNVAAAMAGNGDSMVIWGGSGTRGKCEATVATRHAGGSFGTPVALTSGAKVSAFAATGTTGGNLAVAWSNSANGSVSSDRDGSGVRHACKTWLERHAGPGRRRRVRVCRLVLLKLLCILGGPAVNSEIGANACDIRTPFET